MITSALHKAEDMVGAAVDCLPSLQLTHSQPAESTKPDGKTLATGSEPAKQPDTAAKTPGDKPAPVVPATTYKLPDLTTLDFTLLGMTNPLAAAAIAGAKAVSSAVDLKYLNQNYTVDDFLKASGCDSGACVVTPPTTGKDVSLGKFTVNGNSNAVKLTEGDTVSRAETFLGDAGWNDVLNTIYQQSGKKINLSLAGEPTVPATGKDNVVHADKGAPGAVTEILPVTKENPTPSDKPVSPTGAIKGGIGHIQETINGYVHIDAAGMADFVKDGDNSIRHNADGTTTKINTRTKVETQLKKDGSIDFQRDADGTFEFPGKVPGTTMLVSPDGKTLRLRDGKTEETYDISTGKFVFKGRQAMVAASNDDLPKPEKLFDALHSLFAGNLGITRYRNGMAIVGNDGNVISVNKDGSGTMTLDKNRVMVRTSEGHIEIHYNNGKPTELLSDAQVMTMTGDPKIGPQLKAAFDALQQFAITGKLVKPSGETITKSGDSLTGTAPGVQAAALAGGSVQALDQDTGIRSIISADGKSLQSVASDGKLIALAQLDPVKGLSIEGHDLTIKNGVGITSTGTVFSAQGIKFADGTNFQANGNITASDGTTYNPAGEAIAWEDPNHSSSSSTSDASAKSDEAKAQSQVSQAESMASSIMGKVSSGHATAADIASLMARFDSLATLVSSLSGSADSSLFAAAVMAEGAVGSAIDIAYSNLNRPDDSGKSEHVIVADSASAAHAAGSATGGAATVGAGAVAVGAGAAAAGAAATGQRAGRVNR